VEHVAGVEDYERLQSRRCFEHSFVTEPLAPVQITLAAQTTPITSQMLPHLNGGSAGVANLLF